MKNLSSLPRFYPEGDDKCGVFKIPNGKDFYLVVASDGEGFDHVSVSKHRPNGANINKCPTLDEMKMIKNIFFEEDEMVYQLFPRREDYVNEHPYCLHLWRPNDREFAIPNRSEINDSNKIEEHSIPMDGVLCHYQVFDITDWTALRAWLTKKDLTPIKSPMTWEQTCKLRDMVFGDEEASSSFMFDSNKHESGIEIYMPKDRNLLLTPPSDFVGRVKKY